MAKDSRYARNHFYFPIFGARLRKTSRTIFVNGGSTLCLVMLGYSKAECAKPLFSYAHG
jgi:hypothetical protein